DFYLRRWDVKTGRALFEHAIRPSGFAVPDAEAMHNLGPQGPGSGQKLVSNAVVSPDGRMLMIQVGDDFHSFDVDTGKEKSKLASPLQGAFSLTMSANGKHVRAARSTPKGDGYEVILWERGVGEKPRLILPGSSNCELAFSADGRSIAS